LKAALFYSLAVFDFFLLFLISSCIFKQNGYTGFEPRMDIVLGIGLSLVVETTHRLGTGLLGLGKILL